MAVFACTALTEARRLLQRVRQATREDGAGIATLDGEQFKKTTLWRVSRQVDAPENSEG